MIVNYFVAVCATIVSLICVVLVLHQQYEDGLLGRVALAGISMAGFFRASTLTENYFEYDLSFITVLLWFSAALFFTRHLYRFIKATRSGEHGWRAEPGDDNIQAMLRLK